MKKITFFVFLLIGTMAIFSCDKEDECSSTYDVGMKAIVDASCAFSGCHSGADANANIPDSAKDYTTYAGLKGDLDNGKFTKRALEDKNMPPAAGTALSDAVITSLTCWKDNGYKEN